MKYLFGMMFLLPTLLACSKTNGISEPQPSEPSVEAGVRFRMIVGTTRFTATFYSTPAAEAFKAMLPLTLNMSDFNNNEKVCSLPGGSLATAASNPGTIRAGDVMLYGSNSLVLFYETFSTPYSYTRIGRVDSVSGLKTALGSGNITIKFELEEREN